MKLGSIFWSVKLVVLVLGVVSLSGCTSSDTITLDLSNLNHATTPTVIVTPQSTDWQVIEPGVWYRLQTVTLEHKQEVFSLVKIDPQQHPIHLALDPTQPKSVSEWQTSLSARVVMNAGYFDEQFKPTTRVVINGVSAGPRLSGKTSFLSSPDQTTWSIQTADAVIEPAAWAVQSYPQLIGDGIALVTTPSLDIAQRSIVALDDAGYVYFITTHYGVLTLAELSQVLVEQVDEPFTSALNLDGGASTGLIITTTTLAYTDDSTVVPGVIYIE